MSSDEKHQKVWNKLREIHEEYHSPQKKFREWLMLSDHNNITNVRKINIFIKQIEKLLENSSYKINDDNLFKDELASLVYRLSNVK